MRQAIGMTGLLLTVLALAACLPTARTPKLEPVGVARVEADRTACLKRGGEFHLLAKTGAYVCLSRPRDAGKACSAESDCEGACLARSGTCAPVMPLVGCHEVLTRSGTRVTECVE